MSTPKPLLADDVLARHQASIFARERVSYKDKQGRQCTEARVRFAKVVKDLGPKEVAHLLHKTPRSINHYLNGARLPTPFVMLDIEETFGIAMRLWWKAPFDE